MAQGDALDWLTRWFEAQCDGEWEHEDGITIESLDNPGWSIRIALRSTRLDGRTLERVCHNYDHETDWWTCWTEDNQFHGAGGPQQLASMIAAFREWSEGSLGNGR
jgi:hypothetical protein